MTEKITKCANCGIELEFDDVFLEHFHTDEPTRGEDAIFCPGTKNVAIPVEYGILTPEEEAELERLEAEFEESGGRGVDLAERIDELRMKRDGEDEL